MVDLKDSGLRLRAARLWAKYLAAEDVRRLLKVAGASYRAAEQGRRPIPREVLLDASTELNVTAEFLLGASPADLFEEKVLRLAQLLNEIRPEKFNYEESQRIK